VVIGGTELGHHDRPAKLGSPCTHPARSMAPSREMDVPVVGTAQIRESGDAWRQRTEDRSEGKAVWLGTLRRKGLVLVGDA